MVVRGRSVVRRIVGILILAVSYVACSELVVPDGGQLESDALQYEFPSDGEFVALAGDKCEGYVCEHEAIDASGDTVCVCELEGIGTGPPPPPLPPPPIWPIDWPQPPGWVSEIGGGGGHGGGGTCDPTQFDPPCFEFAATLSCPVNIPRGSTGAFRISVPGRPLTVSKWSFTGPTVTNEWRANSPKWEGTLIESGDVRVDIAVQGIPTTLSHRITVVPRTKGKWSSNPPWQGKISYVKGAGPECGGSRPAAYTVGLKGVLGWFSSWGNPSCGYEAKDRIRIDPFGEAGYRVKKLTSGPNANLWYVEDAWWYFKGTSQLNKGMFQNATQYNLSTTTQGNSCKNAGRGRSSNFYEFNRYCRPEPGFARFIQAAWNHEHAHYDNGQLELRAQENRLYVKVENLVSQTADGVISPLTRFHKDTQDRLRTASGLETGIIGNWYGAVWLWQNQTENYLGESNLLF